MPIILILYLWRTLHVHVASQLFTCLRHVNNVDTFWSGLTGSLSHAIISKH